MFLLKSRFKTIWKIFCLHVAFTCKCISFFHVLQGVDILGKQKRSTVGDTGERFHFQWPWTQVKFHCNAQCSAQCPHHLGDIYWITHPRALWFPRGGRVAPGGEIAVVSFIYLPLLQVTVALIGFLETMLITYLSYKVRTWSLAHTLSFFNQC